MNNTGTLLRRKKIASEKSFFFFSFNYDKLICYSRVYFYQNPSKYSQNMRKTYPPANKCIIVSACDILPKMTLF